MKKTSALVPDLESNEEGVFMKAVLVADSCRVVARWREEKRANSVDISRFDSYALVEAKEYDALGVPHWRVIVGSGDVALRYLDMAVREFAFQRIPESWNPGQD